MARNRGAWVDQHPDVEVYGAAAAEHRHTDGGNDDNEEGNFRTSGALCLVAGTDACENCNMDGCEAVAGMAHVQWSVTVAFVAANG